MYTIYLAGIGEVSIPAKSVRHIGRKVYLVGRDRKHKPINLTVDKICMPGNQPGDCGYCHITTYVYGNTVTRCDIYQALY